MTTPFPKMPSLLQQYETINLQKSELFLKCQRKCGPVSVAPTNSGTIFIKMHDQDLISSASIDDLKNIRNAIDDFLKNVVGVNE